MEGITALLLGFSVASVRTVVGEVTMATHQWDEVTRLLTADQVQLQTKIRIFLGNFSSKMPPSAPENPETPKKNPETPDSAPVPCTWGIRR